MLDELRDRLISYLSRNRFCTLLACDDLGSWAFVVRYESHGLDLECLLPRWSDAAFHMGENPQVLAIVRDVQAMPLRWLQIRGAAQVLESEDDRFLPVRVCPERIDLIDESRGWGVRETLEV